MARIKLIVTGYTEKLSLCASLRRFFPAQRRGEEVIWEVPRKVYSATSHRLVPGAPSSKLMRSLVQAMLAEVAFGPAGTAADLVVLIDDVELANHGQESVVVAHFRDALERKLDEVDREVEDRYRILFRERCSFHLQRPMVESYLFGDPAALATAGVPVGEEPVLLGTDVEQFETGDPAWLPVCRVENARKAVDLPWWRHERHPKHYLAHLAQRGGVSYEGVEHGKNALRGLDWAKVPKSPADTPLIRALFEDLARWFDVANPLGTGDLHPDLDPRSARGSNLILRNL